VAGAASFDLRSDPIDRARHVQEALRVGTYKVGNYGIAQAYAAIVGIVLVAVGLLGFVSNPVVSSDPGAVFATNGIHNVIHIATGLLALSIGFGLTGDAQANGVIGFGALYAAIFVLVFLSPTLFGLFGQATANAADHALHAALAVSALAVGYLARIGSERAVAR
jgi:hypothetical protein